VRQYYKMCRRRDKQDTKALTIWWLFQELPYKSTRSVQVKCQRTQVTQLCSRSVTDQLTMTLFFKSKDSLLIWMGLTIFDIGKHIGIYGCNRREVRVGFTKLEKAHWNRLRARALRLLVEMVKIRMFRRSSSN